MQQQKQPRADGPGPGPAAAGDCLALPPTTLVHQNLGKWLEKNDKVFVAGSRGQALPILHISLHLNPYEALIYFSHLTVPVTP